MKLVCWKVDIYKDLFQFLHDIIINVITKQRIFIFFVYFLKVVFCFEPAHEKLCYTKIRDKLITQILHQNTIIRKIWENKFLLVKQDNPRC
jgi:hypothetical protein